MPEVIPPAAGEVPPAVPPTSVQNPPAAIPPVAPLSEAKVGDPNWLNDRIAQAKKSAEAEILKSIGADSIESAKAKVAEAQKLEDEKKSELQKRDDKISALEKVAAEVTPLREAITARATSEMAGLASDAHRTMVVGLAGEDPAKQLTTIETLRKGGAFTPTSTSPQAVPPPASTTSAGGAPPPTSPAAPNAKATLESLEASNPMAAAGYALRNRNAIYGDGANNT